MRPAASQSSSDRDNRGQYGERHNTDQQDLLDPLAGAEQVGAPTNALMSARACLQAQPRLLIHRNVAPPEEPGLGTYVNTVVAKASCLSSTVISILHAAIRATVQYIPDDQA